MRHIALAIPALILASCGHAESGSSAMGSRSFALAGFDQVHCMDRTMLKS